MEWSVRPCKAVDKLSLGPSVLRTASAPWMVRVMASMSDKEPVMMLTEGFEVICSGSLDGVRTRRVRV